MISSQTLSGEHFDMVARLAHREAGIVLDKTKLPMVQSRLMKRLRALKIERFEDYLDIVANSPDGHEKSELISVLTTNVTHFFREMHHFEMLQSTVFPSVADRVKNGDKLRIWSAGCSFGNEPYSIAMTCHEYFPDHTTLDIRILATDIDPKAVAVARAGEYTEQLIAGVPPKYRDRYFRNGITSDAVRVTENIRKQISFNELNLLGDWPMTGKFDVIFCRNVVIYFDAETQNTLWKRFANILAPNGWLFVGHSERIPERGMGLFKPVGVTAYQVVKQPRG